MANLQSCKIKNSIIAYVQFECLISCLRTCKFADSTRARMPVVNKESTLVAAILPTSPRVSPTRDQLIQICQAYNTAPAGTKNSKPTAPPTRLISGSSSGRSGGSGLGGWCPGLVSGRFQVTGTSTPSIGLHRLVPYHLPTTPTLTPPVAVTFNVPSVTTCQVAETFAGPLSPANP